MPGRGSARFLLPSPRGRRWTATGVLFSRRGPDEGLLPRTLGVKSSFQSLEIRDQHCVARVRAAGDGQAAITGPVEPENLFEVKCVTAFAGPPSADCSQMLPMPFTMWMIANVAAIRGPSQREDRPERWWVAGKPWRVGRPQNGTIARLSGWFWPGEKTQEIHLPSGEMDGRVGRSTLTGPLGRRHSEISSRTYLPTLGTGENHPLAIRRYGGSMYSLPWVNCLRLVPSISMRQMFWPFSLYR